MGLIYQQEVQTGVDINSGLRIDEVCTVTTKEDDTKRYQYSEHRNIWREIQDNYHKKKKVKSVI
jgi:hypothetical protein